MQKLSAALIQHGRATEWLTSICLLMFALTLSLPGDTLAGSGFRAFRAIGLDEAMVATPLALLSAARLVALYINGAWRRSPVLRMVGAIIGAAVFSMLAMAFGWPYLEQTVRATLSAEGFTDLVQRVWGFPGPSTGAGTYMVLAIFEIVAAYRSAADVELASRHQRR